MSDNCHRDHCYVGECDTLCEPQFYPKRKQRAKTVDEKSNSKPIKQQQPIYKCPGPAAYSLYFDSGIKRAPLFTGRQKIRNVGVILDDGTLSILADCYNESVGYTYSSFGFSFGTGISFHRSCPLRVNSASPAPNAYFDGRYNIEDVYLTVKERRAYRRLYRRAFIDYSMGWRAQKEKFSVCDSKRGRSNTTVTVQQKMTWLVNMGLAPGQGALGYLIDPS